MEHITSEGIVKNEHVTDKSEAPITESTGLLARDSAALNGESQVVIFYFANWRTVTLISYMQSTLAKLASCDAIRSRTSGEGVSAQVLGEVGVSSVLSLGHINH